MTEVKSVTPRTVPVLGELRVWIHHRMFPDDELAVGFNEYDTPTMNGLARIVGARLELLAVSAKRQGRGDGGRFIEACQAAYPAVRVLYVENAHLQQMLVRRGFKPFVYYDAGEIITGMEWSKP